MKKVLFGAAICLTLGLGLYACGGGDDGGNAQDPSNVDFSNATGTLSEDNADEVALSALTVTLSIPGAPNALSSNSLISPTIQQGDSCFDGFSQGSTSGSIDLNCLYQGTSCTFNDGSGDFSYNQDNMSFNLNWDNQTMTCENYTFTDYSAEYAYTTSVFCYSNSYTFNDEDISSNFCYNTNGDFLITVNGETYFVGPASGNCATGVSVDITDSEGTHTVTCDVTTPTTCTSYYQVSAVENCTIN
ncbi:MAG: hypothetical protein KDD46_01845 [Bdellovibrionales bacterium]|nr:hypothetical protein [Bdellovibrionales bacterium]